MVNSTAFDTNASIGQEDRNTVKICTQQNQNNPVNVSARYTASSRSSSRQKNPPPDGELPLNAQAPARTEPESKKVTENATTGDNIDDEDNTLCCSVPLDKVQGVLTTIHHPKCDEPKHTRKLLCLYCERSFASANLRLKHVERIHSVKKNRRLSSRKQQLSITPCIYCDKTNSSENTLKELFQHLIDEHSDKYFGCLQCGERFLTSALLSDHHAAVHPTVEIPKTAVKAARTEDDEDDVEEETEATVKLTRSRVNPKLDTDNPKKITARSKNAKLKELRSKKLTVKSSRIAFNRRESKRLQALAKLTDSQKKKRQKPADRKQTNANKPEALNDKANKPTSICVNPYPEFDNFYRVKKITDHSIDNLKISSLTFDDVFDKAFFNRIKCNIEENLLHHIDGKLFKNEESESRISNFEKVSSAQPEIPNSAQDNYGCELSLNAVTPIAALSLNSQFGEDFESQIEYGSKPSKKKTQIKKDEVHYKYFTRRKFQASILEHKENRDLSKLDMWTQLVIKKRQQKIIDDKKSAKEILEYSTCDEYKNKVKKEELNRILDRRGPFEDLREEASKKAALDKLNSVSEDSISHESFNEVREVLNEILSRVFAVTEEPEEVVEQATNIRVGSKPDLREIPSFLNLRRSSSIHTDDEIDQSDKITLICSSQDTENFELPTNAARGKNELIEMSGEWARCRLYICAACGAKLPNMKYLLEHKTIYHQNVWVQHYEFVGNQSELYRHLSIPALGKVGFVEDNAACKMWRRSEARVCSKCKKQCNTLGELHRHILECGGDWTWVLVRKKCKYRYGAKSRRKRRGMVLKVHHTKRKTDSTEKKKYTYNGPRQRPSDAETIQRMLADLPAKRSTRKLISLYDGVRRKQKSKEMENVKQKKVKCGKVIYDRSSNIKETTEKTINTAVPRKKSQLNNKSSNVRALRSLGRVLSSRILDTSTKLTVKRKLKVLNERRRTRQSIVTEKDKDNDEAASQLSKETRKIKIDALKNITPKRTSPRSTKIVRTLKLFTGNANIKSFFPVKKRKVQKEIINETASEPKDAKTRSKKKPKDETEVTPKTLEPITEKDGTKITKSDRLNTLVRSLSMNKKKNLKKASPDPPVEDVASKEELELSRRKRKLKQSFRNVINRVKRLKIDATPMPDTVQSPSVKEKPQTIANSPFLDERKQEQEPAAKIVIPSNIEAKENLADISETVHTVIAFNESNEDSPVPENIFKLDADNEKHLQAKGEPNFDNQEESTAEIIKTEDEKDAGTLCEVSDKDKLEPISIITTFRVKSIPMISPNVKGKIRKPVRGLNDCIAMLTSKLRQKTEPTPKPSSSNVLPPKIVTDPSPQIAECILKIPTFKTHNEASEDVALDLSTKSRNKELPEQLKKTFPTRNNSMFNKDSLWDFTRLTSVERIIENVVSNKFQEPLTLPPSLNSIDRTIQNVIDGHSKQQNSARIRTTVDDIIDYVINFGSPIRINNLSTPAKIFVEDLKLPLLLSTKEPIRKIGSARMLNKTEDIAKEAVPEFEEPDKIKITEELTPENDKPVKTRISSTKEKVIKVVRKIGQLRKYKTIEQPEQVLIETHVDLKDKVPISLVDLNPDKIAINNEDEPQIMENKTVIRDISPPILVIPVEMNLIATKEENVNKEVAKCDDKIQNKSNQNLRNFRKQNKSLKTASEENNEKIDNSNSFDEETGLETTDIDSTRINNIVPKKNIKSKKAAQKTKKRVIKSQEEETVLEEPADSTVSSNTDEVSNERNKETVHNSSIISFKTKKKKKAVKKLRFTKKKTKKSVKSSPVTTDENDRIADVKNHSLPLVENIIEEIFEIPSEDTVVELEVDDKSNDNFVKVEPPKTKNNKSLKKSPVIKSKTISNIIKPAVLSITSILKRDVPKEEINDVDVESILPTYELKHNLISQLTESEAASEEPDKKFKKSIGFKIKKNGSKAKRSTMFKRKTFKFLPLTGIGGETESNTTISENNPVETQPDEDLTNSANKIVENQESTDDTAKENIEQTDESKSSNVPEIENTVEIINNVKPKNAVKNSKKSLKRGRPPKVNKILTSRDDVENANSELAVEENQEKINLLKIEPPSLEAKHEPTFSETSPKNNFEEKRKISNRKSKSKKENLDNLQEMISDTTPTILNVSSQSLNNSTSSETANNSTSSETANNSTSSETANTALDFQETPSRRTTRSLEDLNAPIDQDKPFNDFTRTVNFIEQKTRLTRNTRSLENLTKSVEEEIEYADFPGPKSRSKKSKKTSENVKEIQTLIKDSESLDLLRKPKSRNTKLQESLKDKNLIDEQNTPLLSDVKSTVTEDFAKGTISKEFAEIADTLEDQISFLENENSVLESKESKLSTSEDITKNPTRPRGRKPAIKNLNNYNEESPLNNAEEVSNSTEAPEESTGRPKRSKSTKKSLNIGEEIKGVEIDTEKRKADRPKSAVSLGLTEESKLKFKKKTKSAKKFTKSASLENLNTSKDCEPVATKIIEDSLEFKIKEAIRKSNSIVTSDVSKINETHPRAESAIDQFPEIVADQKLTSKRKLRAPKVNAVANKQEEEEESIFEDEIKDGPKRERSPKKKSSKKQDIILTNHQEEADSVFEDEIRQLPKRPERSVKKKIVQEDNKEIESQVDKESVFEDEIRQELKKLERNGEKKIAQEDNKEIDPLLEEESVFEDEIKQVLKRSERNVKKKIVQEDNKEIEPQVDEESVFKDEIRQGLKILERSAKKKIVQEDNKEIDPQVDKESVFEDEIKHVTKNSKTKSFNNQITQEEVQSVEVEVPVNEENKFEDEILEVPKKTERSTRNKTNKNQNNIVTEKEVAAREEEQIIFEGENRHVSKMDSKNKTHEDQFTEDVVANEVQLDQESVFEDTLRRVQKRNAKKKSTKIDVQNDFSSPIGALRKTRSSTNLMSSNESLIKLNDSLDAEVSKIMEFSEFLTPDQKISNTSTFMNSSQSEGSPYKFKRVSRRSKDPMGNSNLFWSEESLSMTNSEDVTPIDMSPITNLSEPEESPRKSKNITQITSSNELEILPPKAKTTSRNSEESINAPLTKRANKKSKIPAATSVSSCIEESLNTNNSENANPADDFLGQIAAGPLKSLATQKGENNELEDIESLINPPDFNESSIVEETISQINRIEEISSANDSNTDQFQDTSSEGSDVKLLEEKIRNAIRQSLILMSDAEEIDKNVDSTPNSNIINSDDKEDLNQQPIDVKDDYDLKEHDNTEQQSIKKPKRNRNKKLAEIADASKIDNKSIEIETSSSRSLRRKSAVNYAEIEESKEVTDVKPTGSEETKQINNSAVLDDPKNDSTDEPIVDDKKIEGVDLKTKEEAYVLKENFTKNTLLEKNKKRAKLRARKGKKRLIRNKTDIVDNIETLTDNITVISENILTVTNIESALPKDIDVEKEPPIKIIINKHKARRKSKSIKKVGLKGHNDLYEDFALVIKKKRRAPFITFSPPDTFTKEDTYPMEVHHMPKALPDIEKHLEESVEEMDMELDEIPIKTNIIETPKLDLPLPETESMNEEKVTPKVGGKKKKGRSRINRNKSTAAKIVVEDSVLEEIPILKLNLKTNSAQTDNYFPEVINGKPPFVPDNEVTTNFVLDKDDFSSDDFEIDNSFEDSIISIENNTPKQPSVDAEILFNKLIENTEFVKPLILKKTKIFKKKSGKKSKNQTHSEDQTSESELEIDDALIKTSKDDTTNNSIAADASFEVVEAEVEDIYEENFLKPVIKLTKKSKKKGEKRKSKPKNATDKLHNENSDIIDALNKQISQIEDKLSANFEEEEEESTLYSKKSVKSDELAKGDIDKLYAFSETEDIDLEKPIELPRRLPRKNDNLDKQNEFKEESTANESVTNKKPPRRKSKISTSENVKDLNFSGVFSEDKTSETKTAEECTILPENDVNIFTELEGRKSLRSAKVKALENIHDEALAELTDNEITRDKKPAKETKINDIDSKKCNKRSKKAEKNVVNNLEFSTNLFTNKEPTPDPVDDQKDAAVNNTVKKTNKKQKKNEKLLQLTETFNFPKEVFDSEAPLLEELVAELDGLEELENSIERELNAEITKEKKLKDKKPEKEIVEANNECSKEQPDNSLTAEENQELRRSRRGSRKVPSYNENDLIDPLIDAMESKRNKKKEDKAKKEAERKLNSEQLFDLLKASTVENVFVPKQQNSFLNTLEDASREVTDDNFDNVFENMLEKSALIAQKKGDMDKIYEFTESPDNVDALNEDEPKLKIAKKTKKIEDIEQISISQDSTSESKSKSDNFCEICNKYFVKLENLIKHRRTLTHIQKLSELEAKEAEKSKIISRHEDENSRESAIEPPYLPSNPEFDNSDLKIGDILTIKDDIPSSFTANHSLKLADIISDVLNKPVLPCLDEEPNKFADIILQNDTKRYKSLGERKSFDSESLLTSETHMTEPTKTILEKQISLLENIIENQTANNYIDDISLSSEKTDIPTEPGSPIASTPITVNSFVKPIQYEEISEDSANLRSYDDQKLRKTLNRDEELFLECCSLLKSSSEVSSSYSSKKKLSTLNLKSVGAPKWLAKADMLEKNDSNAINDYSDNSRIPTPLGNSYDDDASNSNTISSSWGMNRSADEKLDEGEGVSTSFSFEHVADKNEDDDSGARFDDILPNNRTDFLINEKPTSHRSSTDEIIDGSDIRKIMTKGARKVFEGLKVSIPTEELNMEEVLNNSPKQKKTDSASEKTSEEDKLYSPTSKRKSKPVKKAQIGSNLLFKVSKKKLLSPNIPKDQDDKGYDVYDFEETQDNTDVFTKPNYRAFRTQKVGENENENESDGESIDNTDSYIAPEPVIVVTSTTKKSKAQENITKKKCMIMGRIFKNAAKSKIEDIDEEIRTIPEIDNEELVENYVAECTKVINESTVEETKETINCISEEISEKNQKQTSKPSKIDTKKQEMKKKVKHKGKKRIRTNSDSTDDEFSICKTNKRKTNRKNAKEEDNCINLEQELKECIGVASRKSQRKCTSGKQNVLVEYWSSDDSQFEALLENRIIIVKPRQPRVETVVPEQDIVPVMQPPPEEKNPVQKRFSDSKSKKNRSLDHSADNGGGNRRKRAAVNPLYHWSSSSEDESNDLIEVKPLREGLEDDEDRPVQHGWIVGDSPKKLVTMLAQAKGKKADIDSVKEQGKKRTNTVS